MATVSPEALGIVEIPSTDSGVELDLIQLMEARALEEQLSGAEFARRIGVNHALWSRVRRGLERFGVDACARIVAAYPDLRAPAAQYLTASYRRPALALLAEASRLVHLADRSRPLEREAS